MPSYGGLLEPRGSKLTLLKSTFDAKNFVCGFLSLLSVISAQFTFEMYIAAKNREKFTKTPYFGGVQVN